MKLDQKEILRKKRVLEYAEACGNVLKTCRHFGVSRSNFYIWRTAHRLQGDAGLVRKGPVAKSHPNQNPTEVVEKVLYLRQKYHLGSIRIVWYLRRYHDITISDAGVYRVLRRNGLSRLPRKAGTRAVHTKRYQKQVPGHHIQVDVKFLIFKAKVATPELSRMGPVGGSGNAPTNSFVGPSTCAPAIWRRMASGFGKPIRSRLCTGLADPGCETRWSV